MIYYDEELRKIFGKKYQGCTQAGDELVEYRLKPGQVATPEESAKVGELPKSARQEIDDLKARVDKLEGRA